MYRQIADAINNRKKAETALQESLRVHIGDAEQFDDITLLAIRRIP